jgi:hypothetical protein
MPINIALFFFGSLTLKRSGIGITMIITSEEMLRTAFVMRWLVAAEHWGFEGGTAQYCEKGRHQTPK